MLDNLQITALILLTPLLAFLCSLPLFVSKAAFLTDVEDLPVILNFLDRYYTPGEFTVFT